MNHQLPPQIAPALPGIGLDDLNQQAELLTRVDRKYVLDQAALAIAAEALGRGGRVLEIAGRRVFGYASTYFDTAGQDSFRGAAHKRRRRFKVRIRHYLDSGEAFLEVKTLGARGVTVKHRHPLGRDRGGQAVVFDARALDFLDQQLAGRRLPPARELDLRPVLTSRYQRTTVLAPGGSRVTIDTALGWSLPQGPQLCPSGLVILETKTSGSPGPVDRALWRQGHRPVPISKFATGLAALHPELHHNRWHRVLQTRVLTPQNPHSSHVTDQPLIPVERT